MSLHPSVLLVDLLLFCFAPCFECSVVYRLMATYCLEVSMSRPLLPNLHKPTRTPSPPLSPTLSSSPWGQQSASSGLKPPIMSTSSHPLPQSLRPLLSYQSNRPRFSASPTQGQVHRTVATNHNMSGSQSWWSMVSEQHESCRGWSLERLLPLSSLLPLCLSLPFLLSAWWHSELISRDRHTGRSEEEIRQV